MATTTTRRPNKTLSTTGITLVGASKFHLALNDDSDASYGSCAPTSFGAVTFGSPALDPTDVVVNVVLRLRLGRVDDCSVFCQFRVGPAPFVTLIPPPASGLSDGLPVTVSSAPLTGFTAAQVNAGLEVDLQALGLHSVAIIEAYLDVTHVSTPTVTVTAPVGSSAVSNPTVTWNETGDSPQSRFQVKVFSQSQYEGVGFDPETSGAVYDSGVQTGSQRTFTPVENLTNGGSYRFYVKAAQTVGTVTQWSAWSFSTSTISVAAPAVPTITVEEDDALARIKITVTDVAASGSSSGYGAGLYGAGPYGGGGSGSGTDWQFVTVQRTADGGVTWENVRSATRATVFGDTFVVFDYESCNSQPVQYRAQAIGTSGGGDIASDWSSSSASVMWASLLTWLKAPTTPALNSPVKINQIPTLTRRMPQGVFDIARRRDPIVVSDIRHLSEGTITFAVEDTSAMVALDALLNDSETLLLQTPETDGWGCRYIAVGDIAENRVITKASEDARYFDCPFIEVTSPVGDVVGGSITWADVLALYATWDDVLAANTSWTELLERTP